LFNSLNNITSIFLLGFWFEKKLLRPFEYKQLINTNITNLKTTPIVFLKSILYNLHFFIKKCK
jgi:hypothetical protein